MKNLIASLLGGTALLAGPAFGQNAPQWVAVPPGYTAVIVPGDAPVAAPMLPDPLLMIRQMDALMAQAQQDEDAMQAQFAAAQNTPVQSGGVVITTISDGAHSCTQQVTYPGNGGRPEVQLTSTGNGCTLNGMGQAAPNAPLAPVLLPAAKPSPAAPKVIVAKASSGEMVLADRD